MEDKEKVSKALDLIWQSGGTDGGHHKQWVIDQLVRILSDDYDQWVKDYQGEYDEEDECYEYEWETGIAP